MNIKVEQKKEYIKPQMTVVECEHEGMLCASNPEVIYDDDDMDAEFLPTQSE